MFDFYGIDRNVVCNSDTFYKIDRVLFVSAVSRLPLNTKYGWSLWKLVAKFSKPIFYKFEDLRHTFCTFDLLYSVLLIYCITFRIPSKVQNRVNNDEHYRVIKVSTFQFVFYFLNKYEILRFTSWKE